MPSKTLTSLLYLIIYYLRHYDHVSPESDFSNVVAEKQCMDFLDLVNIMIIP